jgi:formate-dependent nitrite reductase membrane component NrfD
MMPTYDIFHLPALNWITVLYFFFGGLASGSFLLSLWTGYGREELKPVAKPAAVITPISLAIGLLLLVLHLERPFQFWRILITFKPISTTSWGAWVLNVFFIVSILYAFFWLINRPEKAKKLGLFGLPFALFTGFYTGLLLMQMSGNSLWDSALLPWIFLVGGLLTAIAVSVLVLTVSGQEAKEPFYGLRRYICTLIIIELLMISSELVALFTGGADAVEIANILLRGELSFWFINMEVAVGLLIPLGILILAKTSKKAGLHIMVSVLMLIGILIMRFIVVLAGQGQI